MLPLILPDWSGIDKLVDDTKEKLEAFEPAHDCGNGDECKDPLQHLTMSVKICTVRELLRITGKL